MQIMPIAFSVMFVFFPAGLVLYWLINNSLQIFQQWHMNRCLRRRRRPPRRSAASAAAAGARWSGRRGSARVAGMTAPERRRAAPADTIAAIATAPGRGAIGVVRVSAPACRRSSPACSMRRSREGRHARDVPRRTARGARPGPGAPLSGAPLLHGRGVLELSGHGRRGGARPRARALRGARARLARPESSPQRAFLERQLDLAQAEGVADLIEAATATAARAAARSLTGEFSREIRALVDALIELRMLVEATLDFPEEEQDFLRVADARGRARGHSARVVRGARPRAQGALLRDGLVVVLVGRPNVGKSSLLNQLAGDAASPFVHADRGDERADAIRSQIEIAAFR